MNMNIDMASSIKFPGQYCYRIFSLLCKLVKLSESSNMYLYVFNIWWCGSRIGCNREWYNGTTVKIHLSSIAQFFFCLIWHVNISEHGKLCMRFRWLLMAIKWLDRLINLSFSYNCRKDINVKSAHGTVIVFLQNDAGYAKWGPTPERLKELHLAYRPKDSVQ